MTRHWQPIITRRMVHVPSGPGTGSRFHRRDQGNAGLNHHAASRRRISCARYLAGRPSHDVKRAEFSESLSELATGSENSESWVEIGEVDTTGNLDAPY